MKEDIFLITPDMFDNSKSPDSDCRVIGNLPLKNQIKQGNFKCLSDNFFKGVGNEHPIRHQ